MSVNKNQLLKKIEDAFFYEKRFVAEEIAPIGLESSEVREFFANKSNDEITYDSLSAAALENGDFYPEHSLTDMYPKARAYFIGAYMHISVLGEAYADGDTLPDNLIYYLQNESVPLDYIKTQFDEDILKYYESPEAEKKHMDFIESSKQKYQFVKKILTQKQREVVCEFIQYMDENYSEDFVTTNFEKMYLEWCE